MHLYSRFRPKKVAFILVSSLVVSIGFALFLIFAAVNPDCWLHDTYSKCKSDGAATTKATTSTAAKTTTASTTDDPSIANATHYNATDLTQEFASSTLSSSSSSGELAESQGPVSEASSINPLATATWKTPAGDSTTSEDSRSTHLTVDESLEPLESTNTSPATVKVGTGSSSPLLDHSEGMTTGSVTGDMTPSPASVDYLTGNSSHSTVFTVTDFFNTPTTAEPCVDPASEECVPITSCPPEVILSEPAPCNDCQHYFGCFFGVGPTYLKCPDGQLFDVVSLGCAREELAVCVTPLNVCGKLYKASQNI